LLSLPRRGTLLMLVLQVLLLSFNRLLSSVLLVCYCLFLVLAFLLVPVTIWAQGGFFLAKATFSYVLLFTIEFSLQKNVINHTKQRKTSSLKVSRKSLISHRLDISSIEKVNLT
jgi:hypothetical protein